MIEDQRFCERSTYASMRPSAKVIAFPVRTGWDPARAAQRLAAVQVVRRARMPKITPLLLLLAPLILAGWLLSFLAVVGVFLVWLVIVCLLVVGAILFARRLLRRRTTSRGFPQRTIG
jgi:hypothetical protein